MEEIYRYCPRCGAEYDAGSTECADCFVRLVGAGELERLRALGHAEEPRETVIHIAASPQEAHEVAELLAREGLNARVERVNTRAAGLTFRPGWIFHVLVPAREKDRALEAARGGLPGVPASHADGEGREDAAGEPAHGLLSRLRGAIEAGETGLGALEEFFGEAQEMRLAAMKAALRLGEKGRDLVLDWVKKMCLEREFETAEMMPVADACRLLGERGARAAASEIGELLAAADAWIRRNACFALGKLGDRRCIPLLVSALRDPDTTVRAEVLDHLYTFEETDLGFNPDLEPQAQPEALARWEKLARGYDTDTRTRRRRP